MRLLQETAGVALVGVGLGLIANQLSPRGLSLSRDYFPEGRSMARPGGQAQATNSARETVAGRLRRQGLEMISFDELRLVFEGQEPAQGTVVLVDARRAAGFREGHIPGAYSFDRYEKAPDVTDLLGACSVAQKIIVYCNGGSCEDSEFAALDLKQMGVPAERLRVYPGGITEWKAKAMPVELGERDSGKLSSAAEAK